MKSVFQYIIVILGVLTSCTNQKQEITVDKEKNTEAKIDSLLSLMTLEEKIEQLGGIGFDTKTNKRLGIPILRMTDGPVGIRWGEATALPAAVSLASSWDESLLYKVGQLIGKEAKARGRNFFLGPCVNIHRFPIGGRNFESFGEDPYLAGQIAIPYIQGVQSEDVLACVKHFACNNQEWKRSSVNAVVDERALHEIYLPAFKAAVQEGHVWTVMTSYNKLNGDWTAENSYLLNEVLKKKWGFTGFVVSDWGAAHSTAKSAKAGLDLEMPFGEYYNDSLINLAIKNKEITADILDDKVRRLLRVRFEANMFEPKKETSVDILKSKAHKDIAYEAAVNGMVLLKNENNVLPIDTKTNKKIAIIGPNAAFPRVGGGGSSKVTPFYAISPLEGLKNKLGKDIELHYALGTTITDDIQVIENTYFEEINGEKGLQASYFGNINCEGEAHFVRKDRDVNFLWYYDAPSWDFHGADDANYFSVRWKGKLRAPKSGEYKFHVMHNDGVRLSINGKKHIDKWEDKKGSTIEEVKIHLNAGEVYDLQLDYYNNGHVSEIKLGWEIPNTDLIQEAVDAAKKSDMAIVFVGLSDHFEGEGRDREFLILKNQDKLIKKVKEVNPNTVVVVISGTPPIIEDWADDVPAIVQAWFGGQEGGNALADILLGNRNPSGKLPATFYKSQEHSPGFLDYKNENLQSVYSEGIYVGYRYLDKHNIKARYPFGHGLSYTDFEYQKPILKQVGENTFEVKLTVKNTGKIAGAEVVQLYVKPISTSVERPEKELKSFKKIFLEPNTQQEIEFTLSKKAFQYYDVGIQDWKVDKGEYNILIGSSSKDIRQTITSISVN